MPLRLSTCCASVAATLNIVPNGGSVSAQQQFDEKYISSTEVCQELRVHRTTVLLATRTGKLPPPIVLRRPNGDAQIMLWERQSLLPVLADWKQARADRASA